MHCSQKKTKHSMLLQNKHLLRNCSHWIVQIALQDSSSRSIGRVYLEIAGKMTFMMPTQQCHVTEGKDKSSVFSSQRDQQNKKYASSRIMTVDVMKNLPVHSLLKQKKFTISVKEVTANLC